MEAGSQPGTQGEPQDEEQVSAIDRVRDHARLAALRDLELLDSGAIETLDHLTDLVRKAIDAPVALVTLIDDHRQFFLSQNGLDGEFARARQSPLSHSFCKHAVATKRPLIVNDAGEHELVSENLAIRDLDVVAYAGFPLIIDQGGAVGALSAIDSKPRDWTETELEILSQAAVIAQDVIQMHGRLAQMGLRDRLTGLPNRGYLVSYCQELLGLENADRGTVAVMCAGIDNFNQVNQAFGTDSADTVLQAAARRLRSGVRNQDFFGRLRGDVFTLVAGGIHNEKEAEELARRLRQAISDTPLVVDGTDVTVSVTIGIAMSRHGTIGSDLISEAANAMRQGKVLHKSIHRAEEGWSKQAIEHLRFREALAGATRREEIEVAFQPIVRLETSKVVGVEALARWTHPELGKVSPAEFIPWAEITSEIIPIGESVLGTTLEQLARWREDGHPELGATVNVSPLQLEQPNLADVVGASLLSAGLAGDAIGIEITEGALLESGAIQLRNLERLKDLGVRIVLDDFGTGYSALSYLSRFPIDVIKIDRSFVDSLTKERASAALVQAILAMGKGMDVEIVAEGIETEEQCQLLRLLGCRYGQGFHFSRPLPADRISEFMAEQGA